MRPVRGFSTAPVRLEQLTGVSEAEVMELHGMGPKALDHLRRALAAKGQRFDGS
jgi:hypothetical protein